MEHQLDNNFLSTPLCVVIEGATGLRNADCLLNGKSDPYCICQVVSQPHLSFKTRTIQNCLDPVWQHKFVLPGLKQDDVLEFTVMDEDYGKVDEQLGRATLTGADIANGFSGAVDLHGVGTKAGAKLMVKVKVPVMPAEDGGESPDGTSICLWPTWLKKADDLRQQLSLNTLMHRAFSKAVQFDHETVYDIRGYGSRFVLHPECGRRMTWDILGILLLLMDLVWIPLQVFDPPDTPLSQALSWTTMLYWTLDVVATCNTGYFVPDGTLIMDRQNILVQYARTWAVLDVPLVSIDWVVVAFNYMSDRGAGVARSAKLVRLTRIIRLLRLMRFMKLRKLIFTVQGMINSEWVTVMIAVAKNLCTIMAINHVLACTWFYIAELEGEDSWRAHHGVGDGPWHHQYLICLQWSLAQFTPGATAVQPHGDIERAFTVTVLALGMVIATCFVSSITSTMASVWTANRYNHTQHLLLKKFLHQNKVSRSLGSRITRYVDFVLELRHKRVHVSKVHFLSFLSGPLHIELQTELFSPPLCGHPCLDQIHETNKPLMREICTTAVATQNFAKNDGVFHRGNEAKSLLFLTLGTLVYRFKKEGQKRCKTVRINTGSWCVEAVLWMPWMHVGEMKALSEVDMVTVSSTKFREICEGSAEAYQVARGYALSFWQEVEEADLDQITDIGIGHCPRSFALVVDKRTPKAGTLAELAHAEDVQAQLVQWDD